MGLNGTRSRAILRSPPSSGITDLEQVHRMFKLWRLHWLHGWYQIPEFLGIETKMNVTAPDPAPFRTKSYSPRRFLKADFILQPSAVSHHYNNEEDLGYWMSVFPHLTRAVKKLLIPHD